MSDEPVQNLTPSFIELPISGLCVREGELQRRNDKGVIIARHKLSELTGAVIARKFDPTAMVFVTASVGLAIACQILIPSEVWSWLVFAVFMFIGLICFFGVTKATIHIQLNDGDVHYEAQDPPADVEGFVVSLQSIIANGTDRLGP